LNSIRFMRLLIVMGGSWAACNSISLLKGRGYAKT